ncbi:TPA: hypothetical protein I7730_01125 [Vibrio vulnificus]|uniref:Uncharacterized protein n=1 Tax=Vibrio vulnificus TaxID=672 RepID=A0A8H9K5R7_VIBVL|nr:hypothetical protein [Vibrio vulnificus]
MGCSHLAERFTFKIDTSSILGVSFETKDPISFDISNDAARVASEMLHRILFSSGIDRMSWFRLLNMKLCERLKDGPLSGRELLEKESWVSYVDALTRARNNLSLNLH